MDRWPLYQCNIWIQASLKLWQQHLFLHIPLVKQLHLLSPNLDFLSTRKVKMAIQLLFIHSIYFNFQYGPVFNLYHLVAAIMAKTTQTFRWHLPTKFAFEWFSGFTSECFFFNICSPYGSRLNIPYSDANLYYLHSKYNWDII